MSISYSQDSPEAIAASLNTVRRETIIRPPSFLRFDLAGNLSRLIEYRDLLFTLSVHRVKVRYKQTVLGISWAILQPLSIMLLFTLIFSLIVKMPSEGAPYAAFAYTALLPWTYFSTALSNGSNGLVSNSQLITKVYFPREILPLTYVIAALFDFIIASSVMAALMIHYRISLTANAFYAVPIIFILTLFVSAISLFFSAMQVRYRDIGVAMPLLLQVWMFATPVAYPLSAVPERFHTLYLMNPMVGIIENFRRVVLHGLTPAFSSLAMAGLISIVLLAASYIYFKRVEATMADII
jgi:ABC-type polysaccharide/polyol phosphate export systems, permease component